VRGAGVCAGGSEPDPAGAALLAQALASGRPQVTDRWGGTGEGAFPYAAVLPLLRARASIGALVLVGDARDPFTALDDAFLVALGQQVGSALEQTDLYRRLASRTEELARLSARMVEQHEAERRRLTRELHDETAQVYSAVKMELGVLREGITPPQAARLDQVLDLIDTGIRTIRNVTNDLRPSLLDDLGLLPALRSLAADFAERSGIRTSLSAPASLPPLPAEAELALFRALQEALANVARHAAADAVEIGISASGGRVGLTVRDDGRGLPPGPPEDYERRGHMGLAGMRERIGALGGTVRVQAAPTGGALVEVSVPADGAARR
jgi:signal transduction histidine kinase